MEEYLRKRISHAQQRVDSLKEEHGEKPNETHNYFGGKSLGHWEGMLSAYYNILDKIENESL